MNNTSPPHLPSCSHNCRPSYSANSARIRLENCTLCVKQGCVQSLNLCLMPLFLSCISPVSHCPPPPQVRRVPPPLPPGAAELRGQLGAAAHLGAGREGRDQQHRPLTGAGGAGPPQPDGRGAGADGRGGLPQSGLQGLETPIYRLLQCKYTATRMRRCEIKFSFHITFLIFVFVDLIVFFFSISHYQKV